MITQGLSYAKDLGEIRLGSPSPPAENVGNVG